uniref:Uncharacterized protein n=1 Tax=Rhizophora mucronata TaxID=61149 RepID=A0A2P2Q230_RHIMU
MSFVRPLRLTETRSIKEIVSWR